MLVYKRHEIRAQDFDIKHLGAVLAVAYERKFRDFASLILPERMGRINCISGNHSVPSLEEKSKKDLKKAAWTKIRLRLPDFDQAKAAVLNSLRSLESQRFYQHAIMEMIDLQDVL